MSDYIEIPLTRGCVGKISPEDADLAELKWYAHSEEYPRCLRNMDVNGKKMPVSIHRIIAARMFGKTAIKSKKVDHINGDPSDNRRENLRLATHAQNLRNRGVPRNSTTGFKGVYYRKDTGRYQAEITVFYIKISLGCFDTPEEAHDAYAKAALKYHREFARVQ